MILQLRHIFAVGCCIAALLLGSSQLHAADPQVLWASSGQALAAGHFNDAIMGYQELLASGVRNAPIHYNLGIAHFKNNQLGAAIYHFYQARRLDPRDGDIRFNLEYARKKAQDKIEDHRPLPVVVAERFLLLNEKEALYLAVVGILLAMSFATLHIFYKNDLLNWMTRILLALGLLSLTLFFVLKLGSEKVGVVTAGSAEVYSGQGENNVLLFTLHEGAEFCALEQSNSGWLRIQLHDGKKGWIAATEAISEISASSRQ